MGLSRDLRPLVLKLSAPKSREAAPGLTDEDDVDLCRALLSDLLYQSGKGRRIEGGLFSGSQDITFARLRRVDESGEIAGRSCRIGHAREPNALSSKLRKPVYAPAHFVRPGSSA